MKCECGKETNDELPICDDCLFKELKKIHPNITEDIIFLKQPDGSIKEVGIIRGLKFKKNK